MRCAVRPYVFWVLALVLLVYDAIRAADWVDYTGRTTVSGMGNMFYPRDEWGQVIGLGIGLLLFALLEDCETGAAYQSEWDDEYWGEEGDLPVGNVQTELGLGRFVSSNLNIGGRVLFRLDWEDDPLRFVWAWGPELTYYFSARYPTLKTYVGGGRIGRAEDWRLPNGCPAIISSRPKLSVGIRSSIARVSIVAMTPEASIIFQLNYQRDRLDDSYPYQRNGLVLGLGLNFSLY